MEITFDQYVKNPTGGRSHMVGQNEAAKAVYSDKFNKMMMKTAGKIQYWMFKNDQDRYILFMKLPSESIDRLTYDVAIDFYTRDIVQKKLNRLTGYYVRFFSNDPNFTFTYANVFHKNKLIIPELENKLSPESLREKPKVANPSGTVGYVKSIYFAYLLIKQYGLNKKVMFDSYGEKFYKKTILDRVEHANTKVTKRKEEGERIQKAKTIEKRKAANSEPNRNTSGIKVIKPITNTRTTRTTKSIKTTSNIKRK